MTRPALIAALALPLVALLPAAEAAPAPVSSATVTLKDAPFSFEAKTVNLVLGRDGTATVTWKWDTTSMRPHNVEADNKGFNSHPGCAGSVPGLASCGYTAVTSFSQTFRKAGTYRYHCAIHGSAGAGMAGTVVVKAPLRPRR